MTLKETLTSKELKEKIKTYCEDRHISIAEFGKRAGIAGSTINQFVYHERKVIKEGGQNWKKIMAVLNQQDDTEKYTIGMIVHEDSSHKDVRNATRKYLEENKKTQTEVAREIGVNPGTFSVWVNNSEYKGPMNKGIMLTIKKKMISYLRLKKSSQAAPVKETEWIPTYQSEVVLGMLTVAHQFGELAFVIGQAGTGKTSTINYYVKKYGLAKVLTASARMSLSDLYNKLAEMFNVTITSRSHYQRFEALARKLKGCQELLIVDESQHFPFSLIEAMRQLHDATGMGIVLVGNGCILDLVKKDNPILGEQIRSRSSQTIVPADIKTQDVRKMIELQGVEIEEDAYSYIEELAKGEGRFRTLVAIIARAKRMNPDATMLTLDMVKKASVFLYR